VSQDEIMRFLKKHKDEWFTSGEIQSKVGNAFSSTMKCLMALRNSECVNWKYKKGTNRIVYLYKYKEDDEE